MTGKLKAFLSSFILLNTSTHTMHPRAMVTATNPMLTQPCADVGLSRNLTTTENKLLTAVVCHVTLQH